MLILALIMHVLKKISINYILELMMELFLLPKDKLNKENKYLLGIQKDLHGTDLLSHLGLIKLDI